MEQPKRYSIVEMDSGAFLERIDYEMNKVIANVLDPNTKATAKRKLNITFEFISDEDRRTFKANMTVKFTPVPTEPVTTRLCIDSDPRTGEMAVVEMQPQISGQIGMGGDDQSEPKILRFHRLA